MTAQAGYIFKDKKRLRCGYTTGTCAALAARAATRFLLSGRFPVSEQIRTPDGPVAEAGIERTDSGTDPDGIRWASCAVRKDAGDDPDVTNGLYICARVRLEDQRKRLEGTETEISCPRVRIDGGEGIGRVTRAGLDQPPGMAAINSGPRGMITRAVLELLEESGEERTAFVVISAPGGEEIAKKTFNPQLGIQGGISILGTGGIVKPMSEEALVDTIRAELSIRRAAGARIAIAVPGNLGAGYLARYLNGAATGEKALLGTIPEAKTDDERSMIDSPVTCSNFIGKTVDLAGELGFSGLIFAGHIGKLVKLGNGIMNTHSNEGDGRMDTLVSCALSAGADRELLLHIQGANTTNEALDFLRLSGLLKDTMQVLVRRIEKHLAHRAADGLLTAAILFDSDGAVLGETRQARSLLLEMQKAAESLKGNHSV